MGQLVLEQFIEQLRVRMDLAFPEPVNPYDSLFDDLGLDSFRYYELVAVVEALAGCMVPPEDEVELHTLADAFQYYEVCGRIDDEVGSTA